MGVVVDDFNNGTEKYKNYYRILQWPIFRSVIHSSMPCRQAHPTTSKITSTELTALCVEHSSRTRSSILRK